MNASRDSSHHSSFLSSPVSVALLSFYLWFFFPLASHSLGLVVYLIYYIESIGRLSHPVLDTCLTACPIQ